MTIEPQVKQVDSVILERAPKLASEMVELPLAPMDTHGQHVLALVAIACVDTIARQVARREAHDMGFKAAAHQVVATVGTEHGQVECPAKAIRINVRWPTWWAIAATGPVSRYR